MGIVFRARHLRLNRLVAIRMMLAGTYAGRRDFGSDRKPQITDFGLARRLEGTAGLTLSGAPLGTPSDMAPEQARGEPVGVGPAVDV